ncbi:hypothetical protein BASA81_002657 [Batrachochytrium salamandrivorans]|nr:hypothetical protein BASA81_002657 [Batrachochytrium salamandrivorans]
MSEVLTTSEWEAALGELCSLSAVVVAVVGPKSSGKSSFARELFSRVRAKQPCCFIETDLGRPEYIFPGVISAHDHELNLVGALYYGEVEPSQRPQTYLEQVTKICHLVRSKGLNYVIINTHGWVALGQGQDILDGLLQSAEVTRVVEIVVGDAIANGNSTASSLVRRNNEKFQVTTLLPALSGRPKETKAERNDRFAKELLCQMEMFAVGFSQVKLCFPVDVIDRSVPFEFALLGLNTSMVGMFAGEETDPEAFLGVGLVTGLDLDTQCLFLATRVDPRKVSTCRTLVMGTTNRLEMSLFPSQLAFPQQTPTAVSSPIAEPPTNPQPYVTSCNLVGFGTAAKRRGLIKRRRLEH